jgi:hypothetical protein
MPAWRTNSLAVQPRPYQMADTDRVAFVFDAGETITTASAALVVLPAATAASGPTVTTAIAATGCTVTVAGLTRGVTYELDVTFTRANSTKWTRVLAIECVA